MEGENLFRSAKKPGGTDGHTRSGEAVPCRSVELLPPETSKTVLQKQPTIVKGIDAQWQADLADMEALSRDIKGHTFIMMVIDIFNKRECAIPIKNKWGKQMLTALQKGFKDARQSDVRKVR